MELPLMLNVIGFKVEELKKLLVIVRKDNKDETTNLRL